MSLNNLLNECKFTYGIRSFKDTVKFCDRILLLDENNREALYYKASSLYNLKEYDKALELIDEAIAIHPDCSRFHQIKAMFYLDEKDYELALEWSRKGLKAQWSDELAAFEAISLIKLNRFDEVEADVSKLAGELKKRNINAYDYFDYYQRQNPESIEVIDIKKSLINRFNLDEKPQFYMTWIDKIISKYDTYSCPVCGENLQEIVYGYPDKETLLKAERGIIHLGGCCMDMNDPSYHCPECNRDFNFGYYGLNIKTDDEREYEYIVCELEKIKRNTKFGIDMFYLKQRMDHLDDEELDRFIRHLLELEFIYRARDKILFNDVRYPKEGKHAAPRWLVYPELSAWTIGWRMGYGEEYVMNEPPRTPEFHNLFPQPKNWLFNPRKCKVHPIPLLGFLWEDDGKPKYSKTDGDAVIVNDFIKMSDETEFRNDIYHFKSIEHAILLSKYLSFGKCDRDEDLKILKKDFELSDEEERIWNYFKYTVCLNALYYMVMENGFFRKTLLETGSRALQYVSDDEWGGDENLFGLALMEVRDEMKRLWKNEDLIDWQYTDYLQTKDPYINPKPRNPNDKQSPEYRIISSTLTSCSKYVRDVNLSQNLAEKYEIGQIIKEKGFVDASNKIGGMVTSHRYLILSNQMLDMKMVEEARPYDAHVAKAGSKFKVIDIYQIGDKTQIVLVHLPDGFEEVFLNTTDIEKEFVDELRDEFKQTLKLDPVEKLNDDYWTERCSFLLGMSDEGEFFDLE